MKATFYPYPYIFSAFFPVFGGVWGRGTQKCPKCPKCPKNAYRRSSGTINFWDTPSDFWDTKVSQLWPVDLANAEKMLSEVAARRIFAAQGDLLEHMFGDCGRVQLRFA